MSLINGQKSNPTIPGIVSELRQCRIFLDILRKEIPNFQIIEIIGWKSKYSVIWRTRRNPGNVKTEVMPQIFKVAKVRDKDSSEF